MEEKSIGKMIATLRRNSGMTQKELGEQLFVSDKTVSRWERDECTPDLQLIPIIADIFGVTTDEILRGERNPAPPVSTFTSENTPKTKDVEKQIKRLFKLRLKKYKTQNWISVGIALLGVLVAVVCNLVFARGLLGGFLGMGMIIAAVICQICFTNHAFYHPVDEDDETSMTGFEGFNRDVVAVCKRTAQWILVALALPLPLVFLTTPNTGLSFASWWKAAVVCLAIIFFAGFILYRLWIEKALVKADLLQVSAEETGRRRKRKRVLARVGIPCGSVFVAVAIAYLICVNMLSVYQFAKPKTFDNYDDFKAYMAQDILYGEEWRDESGDIHVDTNTEIEELPMGEEKADSVSPEERKYFLFNKNGDEVCEYVWRNQMVRAVHSAPTSDGLPVKIYTKAEISKAYESLETLYFCLEAVMTASCVTFVVLYVVFIKKEQTK